ncbi:helix-turn-helix domain-containing protein [Thalassospira mesophila]|uniref:helix-turn-helix domain-containing protein n=1 Tax=Thalassospira mesophila TaxID=1293891 RepID=UPI001FE3F498|nr:helix-turn-helix domain-containing protein [Thalassospira mesophila]
MFISILGLFQAGFFCVVLLSEGRRAYRANRWMILFIAAVCSNLIEDVFDVFGSAPVNFYGELIFQPFNFVIAPAIYLYFCEAAGAVKIRHGLHLAVVPVVANLTFWLLVGISTPPTDGKLTYELAAAHGPLMVVVLRCIHFGIYLQAAIYAVLMWRVGMRYFRQVQKQLGARRDDMVRWMRSVLGSVLFIFLVFVVQEVTSDFRLRNELWSFQLLNVAFLLVFFWLSYTLATYQVVFVLPDWDENNDGEDAVLDDGLVQPIPVDSAADIGKYENEKPNGGNLRVSEPSIRHFLDKNNGTRNPVTASSDPASFDGVSDAGLPGHDGANSRPGAAQPTPHPDYGVASPRPDEGTAARPLLDDDDAERAILRLQAIRTRGDLLHDPMISLPKLARAVGVSPNQLSYVLNHHIGQNFFDFVNGARIAEASRLLLNQPDRAILDVALEVGFNSKSTFNLAFKKITGETPSSLRRKENGTS